MAAGRLDTRGISDGAVVCCRFALPERRFCMSKAGNLAPASTGVPEEAAVFRRVSLRLLPFLLLLYVINLIDRTNIGIARLQMVDQQHILGEEAYALGAGIFYVGYL